MDTNLFAAVRLDRGFLPSMLKQGSGVIIHIAQVSRQNVVERSIAHLRNADPDYGRRLTEALTPVAIGRAKA
jgi:NAD(P)-dependent dehydrogenase (short-subunit alcohol dehydrogenase family)